MYLVKELMSILSEQDPEAEIVLEIVPGEQCEILDVTEDEGKVVIEGE